MRQVDKGKEKNVYSLFPPLPQNSYTTYRLNYVLFLSPQKLLKMPISLINQATILMHHIATLSAKTTQGPVKQKLTREVTQED